MTGDPRPDRLRVLQVVPDFSLGGAERLVVHLVRHLDPERFRVVAASLYPRAGTDLDDLLAEGGHEARYLGKRPGFDPAVLVRVDRLVRELRPHVVHTHTIALRYVLPVALVRRVPARLHTIHSMPAQEAGRWRWLRRFAFARGFVPVAIAAEVRSEVRRIYGIPDCPCIFNGIPVEHYAAPTVAREAWRRREGFRASDLLFVTVARLDPRKNQALAIRAFAAARDGLGPAHLLLAGEGRAEVRAGLEALAARLGIGDRVRLLGRRTDVPDLLGAADAFVLPSEFEGNPLTVMEAMAAGLPVVATAVGGVPELVQDGASGLLVPPGDEAALGSALRALATDPDRRAAMGRTGQRHARERFRVETMAEAYGRLYESLVARADGIAARGARS